MTKRRLENIATFYVERFATTESQLRLVLRRRAEKARRAHGGDAGDLAEWIDQIVVRFVRTGVVDDVRYAAGRAATLRRLGKSPGKIRAALAAKGVARETIGAALEATALSPAGGDAAWEAALAYARRRRLGPFGQPGADAEARRKKATKDLSALARAGFSYEIARRIIAADTDI